MSNKNILAKKIERKPCGLCTTKLEDFSVTIGNKEILYNINFLLHCGELTALLGPNGAGKTTLLRAILGEIDYSGELIFLDSENRRSKPIVGYVPQRLDFDLSSPISVLDLFSASLSARPVCMGSSRSLKDRAVSNLAKVEAEHLMNRRLGDLSGGELQRVLLSLALDPSPDLLLLDEPVSGIDVQGKELFYNLVSELCRHYDLSVILVSHDWSLVSRYANRIILLDGTVKCCGKPEEVFTDTGILRKYGPMDSAEFDLTYCEPKKAQGVGGINI